LSRAHAPLLFCVNLTNRNEAAAPAFARRGNLFLQPSTCYAGTSAEMTRCSLERGSLIMRSAMAYFAGAGTVIVAIGAGLGGGMLISNIVSPQQPKQGSSELTRLERRMSPEPIQDMNGSSQPVPYLAGSQVSATVAEASAQAASPQPPPQPQAQPQTAAQPVETKQPAQPSPPAAQPVTTAEQPAARERPAADDSFAKARDADPRRDARRAEEKRKSERRQQ